MQNVALVLLNLFRSPLLKPHLSSVVQCKPSASEDPTGSLEDDG